MKSSSKATLLVQEGAIDGNADLDVDLGLLSWQIDPYLNQSYFLTILCSVGVFGGLELGLNLF